MHRLKKRRKGVMKGATNPKFGRKTHMRAINNGKFEEIIQTTQSYDGNI